MYLVLFVFPSDIFTTMGLSWKRYKAVLDWLMECHYLCNLDSFRLSYVTFCVTDSVTST